MESPRIIFWTVKVHLWIIYGDSWIPLIACISIGSSGMGCILMGGFLSWPIGWLRAWSAVILWIGWWASMRGGSLIQGVAVRAVCISVWMLSAWTTPVMSPVVSAVWPRMCSEGFMATLAVVSLVVWLGSRSTAVPICGTVAWSWADVSVYARITIYNDMQVYLRVVFCVDNPQLCVPIHHTQNSVHLVNDMLCGLIPGIKNSYPLHETWHSLWRVVSMWL